MPAPQRNQYVELEGPIFDPRVRKRVREALSEAVEEVGDLSAETFMAAVQAGGFVDTGLFLRSTDSEMVKSGGAIGYAKVAPDEVWPKPDRPTRTWMERGTRRGVKLRKGVGAFRKTTRHMRQQDLAGLAWTYVRKAVE